MTMFSLVLLSYFLVTGGMYPHLYLLSKKRQKTLFLNVLIALGIIYDVIVEPPSVGSTTDEHGHSRPVS